MAGITISTITGNNGILKNTGKAKTNTEIANEKETLEKAIVMAMGNNKYGELEEERLQKELDNETGKGKAEVTDIGEEFEVIFNDNNRYYTVDKNGNVGDAQTIVEDINPGDITIGKDGEKLDGSEEHPYEIWCIEDLVVFSNMVNGEGIKFENGEVIQITGGNNFSEKYVTLKRSLNFKSRLSYADSERSDFGDLNTDGIIEDIKTELTKRDEGCIGFNTIGVNNTYAKSFRGIFEGNNNKIENIYQNIDEQNRKAGLFGYAANGTIRDLTISGDIRGVWHTAGICAEGSVNIINCKNYANIVGYNGSGGIIGESDNSNIKECINYGNITITGRNWDYGGAGGIAGFIRENTTVENCRNEGDIIGNDDNIGGIVGCITRTSKINNCSNSGKSYSGIVGWVRYGDVNLINVYNIGECDNGLVGTFKGANWNDEISLTIKNSYNLGKVTNSGILGTQETICKILTLDVENCYNAGDSDKAIIGKTGISNKTQTSINIKNTYYDTTKSNSVGAVVDGISEMNIYNNQNFINILNNNIGANTNWKTWKLGDKGYPIF